MIPVSVHLLCIATRMTFARLVKRELWLDEFLKKAYPLFRDLRIVLQYRLPPMIASYYIQYANRVVHAGKYVGYVA